MTQATDVSEVQPMVDIHSMPLLSEVYVGVHSDLYNPMVDSWICNNKITFNCQS